MHSITSHMPILYSSTPKKDSIMIDSDQKLSNPDHRIGIEMDSKTTSLNSTMIFLGCSSDKDPCINTSDKEEVHNSERKC